MVWHVLIVIMKVRELIIVDGKIAATIIGCSGCVYECVCVCVWVGAVVHVSVCMIPKEKCTINSIIQ